MLSKYPMAIALGRSRRPGAVRLVEYAIKVVVQSADCEIVKSHRLRSIKVADGSSRLKAQ